MRVGPRRYRDWVASVADLVGAHIERWETASVEEGVFKTTDPGAVASYLGAFCETNLGSHVRDGLFYGSSAGCVAGVELEDGRRLVLKAYQRQWGLPFLSAVRRVQEHLVGAGFPCPRPILGPAPAGPALATVEAFVPDPGVRTLASEVEMGVSARGLADQIGLCRGLSEPTLRDHHPLRPASGRLYPQPHNPLFDFTIRADEAGWIDDLAAAAQVALGADPSPPTVVHTDWSARNVRVDDGRLVVAYDWDSLAMTPESVAVGQAAATWRSTGEATDPIAPGPEEVRAYLSAYIAASGRCFAAVQRTTVMGAALWVLAYTARCEHALEAVTGKRVERARARLADSGCEYLR
jgi:hypothetical protein